MEKDIDNSQPRPLAVTLLASCEDFLDTKKYGAKTDWRPRKT